MFYKTSQAAEIAAEAWMPSFNVFIVTCIKEIYVRLRIKRFSSFAVHALFTYCGYFNIAHLAILHYIVTLSSAFVSIFQSNIDLMNYRT